MQRLAILVVIAAACGKHPGNGNGMPDAPGTGIDAPMSDNGPCMPEALRCNGNTIEQCNAGGTNWVPQQTCMTACIDAQCALMGLDVATDQQMDGLVVVQGTVHVHNGATLSSPSGNLTIVADEIDVDSGGTIAVAPTGTTPAGQGRDGLPTSGNYYYGGAGGGYGTSGSGWTSAQTWGFATDSDVQAGSPGGKAVEETNPTNAPGGGVLKLQAAKIVIAGQLTANGANGQLEQPCAGGGGGGSGGGILVAGDNVTVSGSISAAGGTGGNTTTSCSDPNNNGGQGRVKILFGSAHAVTGSITGAQAVGLAPPYPLASTSHPDPTQVYNDGFTSLDMSWQRPFSTAQGYYVVLDRTQTTIPTPANASFVSATSTSFMPSAVQGGTNYVHVVSIDSMSNLGTIETNFAVQINVDVPRVTSSSHPDTTMFYANANPYFTWTYPQGDANVSKAYYVFDHYGTTVPATTDTLLPATQKQLLESNVANGVWVLHVVSADAMGRLTKLGGNFRVNVGPDPGNGAINGHVVNGSQPVSGATVTVNRGLYYAITDANGNYSLPQVTAGTWEISATSGTLSAVKTATIPAGTPTTVDLTF